MERLTLQGRLRVMLRPLISQVPLIGAGESCCRQLMQLPVVYCRHGM